MAKALPTVTLDALLDKIATGVQEIVCSAQPTTYTEANATFKLAAVTISSGDFTKAAGDTSGRKVTVGAKSAISITASGTATHIAIVDGTQILAITTCTSQALVSGNTVTIPAWKTEVNNPT